MANLKSKIGNRKSAMYLSFRKLEAFARALLPVFLSFLDSRIARNQAGVFESRAQVGIKLEQRACNAVTNGACLSGRAAAGDVDHEVKLAGRFGQLQRLPNDHAQGLIREVTLKRFAVHLHFAAAWPQIDSGRRRFAPSRSVILNF